MSLKAFSVIFLILLFSYGKSAGQELNQIAYDKFISDSIMTVAQYGVYATHEDFLNNKPTITSEFTLRSKSKLTYVTYLSPNKKLIVTDEKKNKEDRLDNFWGAFDGEKLYVKNGAIIMTINYFGRYNLAMIEPWGEKKTFGIPIIRPPVINVSGYYANKIASDAIERQRIYDLATNIWYEFTPSGFKKLLTNTESPLLDEYAKDERGGKRLFFYMKKLNNIP